MDDTIKILHSDDDTELWPIVTGTYIPKSMIKLNNILKGNDHDLKEGHHGQIYGFHTTPNGMKFDEKQNNTYKSKGV